MLVFSPSLSFLLPRERYCITAKARVIRAKIRTVEYIIEFIACKGFASIVRNIRRLFLFRFFFLTLTTIFRVDVDYRLAFFPRNWKIGFSEGPFWKPNALYQQLRPKNRSGLHSRKVEHPHEWKLPLPELFVRSSELSKSCKRPTSQFRYFPSTPYFLPLNTKEW